jgi:hypothetical protein
MFDWRTTAIASIIISPCSSFYLSEDERHDGQPSMGAIDFGIISTTRGRW